MERTEGKVRIIVDGRELLTEPGETILDAARKNDIHIPTLCHHPALTPWGGCRLCVVEVDGAAKLAASCVTPVRDGMEVVTSNERILESRRAVLEFLFAERNHNCMFCPQSGSCELQGLAYEMQMDHLTVSSSFQEFPTDVTSEYMVMDHNRCVLCGRCVRGCAQLAGNHVLQFQYRGPKSLVGIDLDNSREGSTCLSCGLCMQLCPTGAITSRYRSHYSVKGHEGKKKAVESVCAVCGLLCPTIVTTAGDTLLKIEGRFSNANGRPDQGQLCRRGRFDLFKEDQRLTSPMVLEKDGKWKDERWEEAVRVASVGLRGLKERYGGNRLLCLASSNLSNEELILFKDFSGSLESGYVDTLDGIHYRSAVKGLESAGGALREAPWKKIVDADFLLLLGGDPFETQPVLASLIRKGMLERGVKAAVAGKPDTCTAPGTMEIPLRSGKETPFMKAFLASALRRGNGSAGALKNGGSARIIQTDVEGILSEICPSSEARRSFAGAVGAFLDSRNPLVLAAPSITQEPEAVRLAAEISMVKGFVENRTLRLILLKTSGNSAGSWKLSIPAMLESDGDREWKGGVVLLSGASEPHPLPDFLKGLEFVVVVSPFFREEFAGKAHVLLPRPRWVEGEGTFTSLDGRETAFAERILDPPPGVQDAWKTLVDLAGGCGSPLSVKSWDQLKSRGGDDEVVNRIDDR